MSDTRIGEPAESAAGPELYTRQSSGLTRSLSLTSAAYMNVTNIGIIFAILVITGLPANFPGSNPVLMAVICTAVCIPPALLYGMWCATVPRSGADYVWNSRMFAPWVGFAASFVAVTWFVLSNGFLAYLIGADALPTAFFLIGTAFESQTIVDWGATVSGANWTFVIGTVTLMVTAAVAGLGMRRTIRVVAALLAITVSGALLAIIILLVHSHDDFVAAVASGGGNFAGIIDGAREAGYTRPGYSLGTTLLSMVPLYLALGYSTASAYAGGELRNSRVSGMWGPLLGVAAAALIILPSFIAAGSTIGFDFIGSATTLSNAGSEAYSLPNGPNFFYLVSLLSGSDVLNVWLAVSYFTAPLATLLVVTLYTTRAVFAWSFDRIMPDRLAEVSPRTGAPIPALIYVFAMGELYLIGIRLFDTTTLGVLGSIVVGSAVAFMLAAVGAMMLPFVKKARHIYQASPIQGNLLGIPKVTLLGATAFCVYAFMFYSALTQDANGANTTKGLIAQALVFGAALLIFPVSYYLNRRRGVDLRLLGRELPPE